MMFLVFLSVLLLLLVARALLRDERAGRLLPPEARADPEVARLRDEVDRLSAQVERLTDEQGFLLRLLDERRPPLPLSPPEEERVDGGEEPQAH